ncbi:hypothetical protein LJS53_003417 [Salmonella enterica]|nr:hypothetical protein [Salmonella enterica]
MAMGFERCRKCRGKGEGIFDCQNCSGTGREPKEGKPFGQCHTCYGDGEYEQVCPACFGLGEIYSPTALPDDSKYIDGLETMKTSDIINIATEQLLNLESREFDVITVSKPVSPDAAVNLAKIISKLSPIVGNLIEFHTCDYLNSQDTYAELGHWVRQDPGFPDTIFVSDEITPTPGFEIKAWFPLATEITARFKDSQNHFSEDQTYVAMLAWLPEYLIFGKPKVIDIVIVSAMSVARARDLHYHRPPDYIVLEPEDTTLRTGNLQQTNTNGYKFQGTQEQFIEAQQLVASWQPYAQEYSPTPEYQEMLRTLIARYPYRLDTNFAKMDRIVHPQIEEFKTRVHNTRFHGKTIGAWNKLLSKGNESEILIALSDTFGISDDGDTAVE